MEGMVFMATLRENAESVRKGILRNLDIMRKGCMDELGRSGADYFRLKRLSTERSASAHRRAEEASMLLDWVEGVCSSVESVDFPAIPAPNGGTRVEMAPEVIHVGTGNIESNQPI